MDNTAVVVIGLIILLVLATGFISMRGTGRGFLWSWKNRLFGEVSAEVNPPPPTKSLRPEQTLENSVNVKQTMDGKTGGKQVAKDSENSSQKIL